MPKNFQNERSRLLFINCFALMIYLEVSYLKAMFGDCAQEQSSGTAQAAKDVLITQDIRRIGFIDRLVCLLSFRYLFYFCLGS